MSAFFLVPLQGTLRTTKNTKNTKGRTFSSFVFFVFSVVNRILHLFSGARIWYQRDITAISPSYPAGWIDLSGAAR